MTKAEQEIKKERKAMSTIGIRKISITELDTDAVVNAANEGLRAGSGVCGAIFAAAGYEALAAACARMTEAISSIACGAVLSAREMPCCARTSP